MDHTTQPLTSSFSATPQSPTSIWVGSPNTLRSRLEQFLQEKFCLYNRCTICISCSRVTQRAHENILWISPEKAYTRADIDNLLYTISFKRSLEEPFYCILEKGETLSSVCTNALLKSLEEPSPGYHFIICTQSLGNLAITLQSRAHIIYCPTTDLIPQEAHPLYTLFTQKSTPSFHFFISTLEAAAGSLTEYDTLNLCNQLLSFWTEEYKEILAKKGSDSEKRQAERASLLLSALLHKPLVPASSSLVLKDLFLQLYCHDTRKS